MNKQIALLTLLENSFWITDAVKKTIISKLATLTNEQIDDLGKFLSAERNAILENKENILSDTEKLLEIIQTDAIENTHEY